MKKEIVQSIASLILFKFLPEIRVGHWSTASYAMHMATGGMYDFLSTWLDGFVEVATGKYGRFDALKCEGEDIKFDAKTWISGMRELCDGLKKETAGERDTDLSNIVDEILAEVNKFAYLLTLK